MLGRLMLAQAQECVFENSIANGSAPGVCAKISRQVELQEGPLDQFTHEMEPFLYKQGMPVRLNKGWWSLFQTLLFVNRGSHCPRIMRLPSQATRFSKVGVKLSLFLVPLAGP
ncbi:Vacuolar-sorting protein BRO1 [Camellia lanceoleosa]|uniref:Vacuolar-sorting protein BRO1 n=1 Tax=Camellia lanceoleosa TaxID=1840588 RepID=A0ACC0FQ74_9ERIC|nr:Vacuolar-sorting protein BRO1 [Camellia lanceoleosa]